MSDKQVFFVRAPNGEWVQLDDPIIKVEIKRRMTRTVTHGGEGDDLVDEGAESAIYRVSGAITLEKYKLLLDIFRGGQPYIHEPFEERELKVVFSSLIFDGGTSEYEFEFIEDIV